MSFKISYAKHVFLEPESNPNILKPDPTRIPQTSLPINLRTTVSKVQLPTFTRPESSRRSTRRPVTTSSFRTTTTTTRLKIVKIAFQIPLKCEKYDCNIYGFGCKYRKQYKKLLWLWRFSKSVTAKINFWLWRFFEVDTAKKTIGCVDFLSHKKMAVEKMKSHFGCGICPDRIKTVFLLFKNASKRDVLEFLNFS